MGWNDELEAPRLLADAILVWTEPQNKWPHRLGRGAY